MKPNTNIQRPAGGENDESAWINALCRKAKRGNVAAIRLLLDIRRENAIEEMKFKLFGI